MSPAKRAVALALVTAALLGAGAPTQAGDVVKRRLGNGVTLIAVPSPWNKVLAVSVLVDAGSKHDPPGLSGLARVTAELLLSGATTIPRAEIEETVDDRGIRLGSYTTEDFTEIYVVSTIDQFDAAIDVLSALVTQPAFDGRDLPIVQRRVVEDQERALNDPFAACYARLNEILFEGHPYAVPPSGTKSGVAALTRDHVTRFYADRYRGGNIVVTAVGDFREDEAMRKLGACFAACASGRVPPRGIPLKQPKEPVSYEFHRDVSRGCVTIGFATPPMGSHDGAAVRVLASVLGEGKAARGRIRDALPPDDASSSQAGVLNPEGVEQGRLVLFASTADVDAAAAALGEIIERLRSERVPDAELAEAKERLLGQMALAGQRNIERAGRLGIGEIARLGHDSSDRLARSIEAVSAEDVRRAAVKYLSNPVTVTLRPGRVSRTQL